MHWFEASDDIREYRPNDRIEMRPGTDAWMSGDHFGTIVSVGRRLLRVRMDHSGKTIKTVPSCIGRIQERG